MSYTAAKVSPAEMARFKAPWKARSQPAPPLPLPPAQPARPAFDLSSPLPDVKASLTRKLGELINRIHAAARDRGRDVQSFRALALAAGAAIKDGNLPAAQLEITKLSSALAADERLAELAGLDTDPTPWQPFPAAPSDAPTPAHVVAPSPFQAQAEAGQPGAPAARTKQSSNYVAPDLDRSAATPAPVLPAPRERNGIRIEYAQAQPAAPAPAPAQVVAPAIGTAVAERSGQDLPVVPAPALPQAAASANPKEARSEWANRKDWKQLCKLMNQKWSEANTFVQSRVLPSEDYQDEAQNILKSKILSMVKTGNRNYDSDNEAGGTYIRDEVLPEMQGFLDHYRQIAKRTPRTVRVDDKDVEIYWTDIPGYEAMQPQERAEAERKAAQRVVSGMAVYDAIVNPPNGQAPKATHEKAGDLVWALKSKAQKANDPYIKGAMIVPNGEKIRKYLDGLGGADGHVYPRSSSHLTEQQGQAGQQARGMDFYGKAGKPGTLPAGMNTLLYQQVTLPSKETALYMKMETAGAFGTDKWNWVNGVWGSDPTMPASRAARPDDAAHAKEHGDNYLSGKKETDRELGAKREDMPKEVKDAWKVYLGTVNNRNWKDKLKAAGSGTLRLNKVLTALKELSRDARSNYDPKHDEGLKTFMEVVKKFGLFGTEDQMDSRFGGEAVLTAKDLA